MQLLLALALSIGPLPAKASVKGSAGRQGPAAGAAPSAAASQAPKLQGIRFNAPLTAAPSAAPPPVLAPAGADRPAPETRPGPTAAVELPSSAVPDAVVAGREAPGGDREEDGLLPRLLDPEGPMASGVAEARGGGSGAGLGAVYEGTDPLALRAGEVLGAVSLQRRWFGRDTLRRDGRALKVLGRGNFGSVLTDHSETDIALKVVEPNTDVLLFTTLTIQDIVKEEEEITRLLSDSGAGPRYFGRRNVGGRIVFAKERIRGESLETIIRERRFGSEDHRLILEMLDRMAAHRLIPDDMRPANILIGHTASDPARRAYLVDAIKEKVDGATAASLVQRGGFGPEERRLVGELLREAGQPPLAADDPRAARIAVGVTQKNPRERRAYFVDAGLNREVLFPYLSYEEARAALRKNGVVVKVIGNPMAGTQEALHQPFEQILEEGLARAKRTRWWQRLLDALGEAFNNAQFPDR